ncbi:MAG: hypothetical protein R2861_05450 [Desulfobacterales bacterium]
MNILDPEMLKDAQENPQDYRHLLSDHRIQCLFYLCGPGVAE